MQTQQIYEAIKDNLYNTFPEERTPSKRILQSQQDKHCESEGNQVGELLKASLHQNGKIPSNSTAMQEQVNTQAEEEIKCINPKLETLYNSLLDRLPEGIPSLSTTTENPKKAASLKVHRSALSAQYQRIK